MPINQIIEKIDAIALESSFIDYNDEKELTLFFDQLNETNPLFQSSGVTTSTDYFSVFKEKLFAETDLQKKQRILSFSIDYLQNFLKNLSKDNTASLDVVLFEQELENLFEAKKNDFSAVNRIESNPELVSEFIQNTNTVIEDIEADILSLEDEGICEEETINNVFRAFHTIKSEANLLSLLNIGTLSHKIEDLLSSIRSNKIELDENIVSTLLEAVDVYKSYLDLLSKDFKAAINKDLSKTTNKFEIFSSLFEEMLDSDDLSTNNTNEEGSKTMDTDNKPFSESSNFKPTIPNLDLSEGADMLTEFSSEAREHLTNSEEAVLFLESNPTDMESVNLIFRAFHTIKGVTSFLELLDIKVLAHTSETMLDLVRKSSLDFSSDVSEATLQSIDNLRTLLDLLEEQIANGGTLTSEYLDVGPQLAKLQAIIQGQPSQEQTAAKPVGEIMVNEGIVTPSELGNALNIQETEFPDKKVGEILQQTNAASKKDVNKALNIQSGKIDSSIKISVDKLDILVDLVGELVISETQVIQNKSLNTLVDNRLVKDLSELDRITRSLQESAMSMRLVPIKSTFQKMVRIVRDLSKKAGKDINVQLIGEDTEIDKNMVELVSDPLVHMVRNSADHGIESPDIRKAKGKQAVGNIVLSAFHKAGSVVVQIEDDGAGLNKEKILAKAKEKGIISADEVLPDKRIWNLIFEPGFSTADKVTDVSGRGVGMDVVRKNIEKLRGRIEITSEKKKGSCFSIYMPITLAIIEGIVVRTGEERHIIPINSIIEFASPDERKKNDVVGKGELYRFHEEVISLIYFDKLLNIQSSLKTLEEKTICVCESEYGHYCFVVDEVLGQQQVVIKNLGEKLKGLKGVSGGAILGDGRVGLILDINGLVEYSRSQEYISQQERAQYERA